MEKLGAIELKTWQSLTQAEFYALLYIQAGRIGVAKKSSNSGTYADARANRPQIAEGVEN